jgi:hypothetical protein
MPSTCCPKCGASVEFNFDAIQSVISCERCRSNFCPNTGEVVHAEQIVEEPEDYTAPPSARAQVPAAVIALVIGIVLVVGCIGLVVQGDKMTAGQAGRSSAGNSSAHGNRIADVSVSVPQVRIQTVQFYNVLGDLEFDQKAERLVVFLDITNHSASKKVDYQSWSYPSIKAHLYDELGNAYSCIEYGYFNHAIASRRTKAGGWDSIHQLDNMAIHPGMLLHDFLVFERPVAPARTLTLELAGGNCGVWGTFRLEIATSAIQKN